MNVGFWIRDFQVLETEVQMIMDLLGRKVKIWVRISSGKYPNELTSCCLTLPPISKRERTNEGRRLRSVERTEKARLKSGLKPKKKTSLSSSFFNIAFVHNIYLYSLVFFFY